uniref:AV422 n=1 Tax=Ixodes ricinus TaxID=34613 RepID=A0A8F2ZD32_IXORI|nr:AV422 [Ixodes ricinus]
MRTFALFAAIIAVAAYQVHGQACHLRELDLCAASLLLFNQNPSGVATTDAEVDKQCGFLKESQECFRNFTTRCTTPLQRELIGFVSEGSQELFKQFCSKGTEIRTNYLKHAPCLGQTLPQQKLCLTDIQAGLEKIAVVPFNDRVPAACCMYSRYQACTRKAITEKCGAEAIEFGEVLVKMAASDLPNVVCNSFDAKNPRCSALLPPPGTKPTGKSNSVLSRLFSAYLGN